MANKRILVIDDDADLVASTTAFLAARGYEARGARNGTEAWAMLPAFRPHLLVLDIMMDRDAEGFDLAYRLRQDPAWRSLPIVVASSFQEHLGDRMEAFQAVLGREWPADALLEKPVSPDRLAETVGRLLADADAAGAASPA